MVREHLLAVAVHIGAEKILGASHHDRIGAVQPGTAAAGRGEEVVVVSAFVDVCGLESRAGDRLNGRGVQREPVVRQPGAPDAAETPPKEVFRAILLDEERVDRVQTADLLNSLPWLIQGPSGVSASATPMPQSSMPPHEESE